jgi:hypothetical protein
MKLFQVGQAHLGYFDMWLVYADDKDTAKQIVAVKVAAEEAINLNFDSFKKSLTVRELPLTENEVLQHNTIRVQ